MSGNLTHSAADIVATLLVDLGLGATAPATPWPVFVGQIPDSPDSVIRVGDTLGTSDGRAQVSGEIMEHPGFQIMVRSPNRPAGHTKADAIKTALAETVQLNTVTISGSVYLVYAIAKIVGVLDIGKELPASKRNLFTINATLAVRQTT